MVSNSLLTLGKEETLHSCCLGLLEQSSFELVEFYIKDSLEMAGIYPEDDLEIIIHW